MDDILHFSDVTINNNLISEKVEHTSEVVYMHICAKINQ